MTNASFNFSSNLHASLCIFNPVWHSGSVLVLINEVNLRQAQLLLGWVTVSGFNSRCRTLISVCNQPPRLTQPSIPLGSVNEYQHQLGRKRQQKMVHSISGWTRGMQVKLWDPLRTRAVPERLRGVFRTRRYTNPHLPYLTLLWQTTMLISFSSLWRDANEFSTNLFVLILSTVKCLHLHVPSSSSYFWRCTIYQIFYWLHILFCNSAQ